MNFEEYLNTLPELEDYSVEIDLDSGEKVVIENIEGKKGSLRLLQAFLNGKNISTDIFPLEDFCENYHEWLSKPDGKHTTINFLNKYNEEGGIIRKVK